MSKMGFLNKSNNAYAYVEVPQTYTYPSSAALGIDQTTGDLNISVSPTQGATPVSGQIVIESSVNGDITLTPNGSGNIVANGVYDITVGSTNNFVIVDNDGTLGSADFTQYAVQVGSGTNNLTQISPGTAGFVLTSNGASANPTFEPIAQVGLQSATVTLTSTQIKNLVGNPITLVAAQGSGTIIDIVSYVAYFTYGGTNAFTNSGNATIVFSYGTANFSVGTIANNLMIVGTQDSVSMYSSSATVGGASTSFLNEPLTAANSTISNIGGNAANDNTLTIEVIYTVFEL